MNHRMSINSAILLTPPGVAGIAVVRLVGAGVGAFLQAHFSRTPRPMRAVHGKLRDAKGDEIDDPVVVLAKDVHHADINLHGGAWVVRATLLLAHNAGFQILEHLPVPLPDDALDATDTIEREIEAYLPLATTELALRTLLAQKNAWSELMQSAGRVSQVQHSNERQDRATARLSSPKSEVTQPVGGEMMERVLKDRALHWLLHPPRVAIVGAPNVGKSTLANRLFAQERSITADMPGTTRDWVGEMANLDGLAVRLVDTPGIRATDDPIEQEAIHRSAPQIERADLVLLVLDASDVLEPEQAALVARYPGAMCVISKIDAAHVWDVSRFNAIQTCGKTGGGVDELMRSIRAYFQCDAIDPTRPRCWTARQQALLQTGMAADKASL